MVRRQTKHCAMSSSPRSSTVVVFVLLICAVTYVTSQDADGTGNKNNNNNNNNKNNKEENSADSNNENGNKKGDDTGNDNNNNKADDTADDSDDKSDNSDSDKEDDNTNKNNNNNDKNDKDSNVNDDTNNEDSKDNADNNKNNNNNKEEESNNNGNDNGDDSEKNSDDGTADDKEDGVDENGDDNNNNNDKDKGETTTTEIPPEETTTAGPQCKKNTCVHGSCNNDTTSPDLCVCEPGWTGSTCDEDIDECQRKGTCAQVCVNTEGSYTCQCNAGFTFIDDKNCEDVDECLEQTADCGEREFCANTEGGFQCVCRPGYGGASCKEEVHKVYGGALTFQVLGEKQQAWSSDLLQPHSQAFQSLAARVEKPISDVLHKKDIRLVAVNVVKFSRQSGDPVTIVAEYQVQMKQEEDMTRLQRAMESGFSRCKEDVCDFGAYSNHLLYGVVKDPLAFEENYDLCKDDRNNVCHDVTTECVTANGTSSCYCRPGFEPWTLYENACKDIDECAGGDVRQLCGTSSARCLNTAGSYYCTCPRTDRWDSQKMACVWWNICKRDKPCLNGGQCYNTADKNHNAGFVCRCPYWWTGRVCGSVDPEAEQMRNIMIGVAVGLFVLCVVLTIIIILLCLQRRKRNQEDKKKNTAFGSYDFGNTTPPLPRTPTTPSKTTDDTTTTATTMQHILPPPPTTPTTPTKKPDDTTTTATTMQHILPPPPTTPTTPTKKPDDTTTTATTIQHILPLLRAEPIATATAAISAADESIYGGDRLSGGSPVASVTGEGIPTWGESPPSSPRKGKSSVFGSYDFGFTPKRSVEKKKQKNKGNKAAVGGGGHNGHAARSGKKTDGSTKKHFDAYEYINSL